MPYPNEHSCRLKDPENLDIVGSGDRKHDGKTYRVIFGKPKGGDGSVEQAYRYPVDSWSEAEARSHCEAHKGSFHPATGERVHEHVTALLPFKILEKIIDKPLKIRGVAMTAGMSRNFNIYTPEELQNFTQKLVSAPVYLEHVSAMNSVGKVAKTEWDPESETLFYEAEIYDDQTAAKIRKGLIQHVSVAADYETLDILDGRVPHGLHNAELSLVAIPGIPATNIQVMEKLHKITTRQQCEEEAGGVWDPETKKCWSLGQLTKPKEQAAQQEFVYVQLDDPHKFLPEHFSVSWVDQTNGIQGLFGLPRETPTAPQLFALLFMKVKGWDLEKANAWLREHPQYVKISPEPVGVQVSPPSSIVMENKTMKEKKIKEAEWDVEYINDLPDSAFAIIASGGEKDEQGKTVPRTLRKLPYKNIQGNVDLPHLRNALARLNQIEPASLIPAAKKKLCTAARSEKAEDLVSKFCGEEKPAEKSIKEQEPPKAGQPKTDRERLIAHFGEEVALKLLDLIGEEAYKLLPERGTKVQEQEGNELTEEEIKKKIANFAAQREELYNQMQQLAQEERAEIEQKITVIDAEIEAYKQKLAATIQEQQGEDTPPPEEIKPKEDEDYKTFIARCIKSDKSMEDCAAIWKEMHPEKEPEPSMEEALASPVSDDMISKKEILEIIPPESIIRCWKCAGAMRLVRELRYKLTGKAI